MTSLSFKAPSIQYSKILWATYGSTALKGSSSKYISASE